MSAGIYRQLYEEAVKHIQPLVTILPLTPFARSVMLAAWRHRP